MAIYLAREGFEVEVYERRPDMRDEPEERGRSINMTIAERGLRALDAAGALAKVLPLTVPIRGRMVHGLDGSQVFQPYGKNDDEAIYAIMRRDLNITLMDEAQCYPNVKMFFNARCVRIDKESDAVHLRNEVTGENHVVRCPHLIGADGTFSTVRRQLQRIERVNFHQEFLDHGYKELRIPPKPNGDFRLDHKALHVWPRGDRMLLAIPNRDGSFTCTCILPFKGPVSFQSLQTETDILTFFKSHFPDAIPLVPGLVDEFQHNRTAEFITTYTFPWQHKGRIVLLGDACHSVVPFYGQGMNAAFEDCVVLNACIARNGENWEAAFEEFEQLRKRNTDALAVLSKENFLVLCQKARSTAFIARKKVELGLNRLMPRVWMPLYTMVTHTTMPYADAVAKAKKQERIARLLGIDLVVGLLALLIVLTKMLKASTGAASRQALPYITRLGLVGQNGTAKDAAAQKSSGNS